MSDLNNPNEQLETVAEKKPALLEGRVSTDVTASERDDALTNNPNRSDGSLQKYADKPIARSIEIHAVDLDGKPVKIDKNSLHKERSLSTLTTDEAAKEATAQKLKHERISRSVVMLAYEAKHNPVMEPVHLAREYADRLPDTHPDKEKLTDLARQQAAEFSPNLKQFYEQKGAKEDEQRIELSVKAELVSGKPEAQRQPVETEKPLENNLEGWQRIAEKIANLTPDQQFQLVTNLIKEQQVIERQKAIGGLIGIVEGTESIVMDTCNVFQFAGDVLVNPKRAEKTISETSMSLWNASVSGLQLLEVGAVCGVKYAGEVIQSGDPRKPFVDAYKFGAFLEKEWDKLGPLEQEKLKYRFATEAVGAMIPVGNAGKLAKAEKLAEILSKTGKLAEATKVAEVLKTVASYMREVGGDIKDSGKAFVNYINDITRFGKAWQTANDAPLSKPGLIDHIKDAGKNIKEHLDEFHNKMVKKEPGGDGQNLKGSTSGSEKLHMIGKDGTVLKFEKIDALEISETVGDAKSTHWLGANFLTGWKVEGALKQKFMAAGEALANNFPAIDGWAFEKGNVTSIKSIELRAKTYQNMEDFEKKLVDYATELERYDGTYGPIQGITIRSERIKQKTLHLGVPEGAMTLEQKKVLEKVAKELVAHGSDVKIKVTALK